MKYFSHFLTCGQDGDIHIFDTKTDNIEHIRCADQCFCLSVHVSFKKKEFLYFVLLKKRNLIYLLEQIEMNLKFVHIHTETLCQVLHILLSPYQHFVYQIHHFLLEQSNLSNKFSF